MLTKYRSILLFGAPGSGKGTQGKILDMIPGLFHCSTGDIFRKLDMKTELGRIFMQYSSTGQLLPTDITLKIWASYIQDEIEKKEFDPDKDFLLLDGLPRTLEQANKLQDRINVLKVIHIKCDDPKVLIDRISKRAEKENRIDDVKASIIENRIKIYEQETYPILEQYYKDKVVHISGNQTPLKVAKEVIDVIAELD